jgi:hypothetical protein
MPKTKTEEEKQFRKQTKLLKFTVNKLITE